MIFSYLTHFSNQIILYSKMKRNFFLFPVLFIILSLTACGKIPDEIVDNQFADYQVQKITAPSSFVYSDTDSLISISIQINNFSNVNKVWTSIKSMDGKQYLTRDLQLYDDGNKYRGDTKAGDGIFSETFAMSKKYSNGKYIIEFFVEDVLGLGSQSIVKVGEQSVTYDNKQTNYAPVISNLKMPDSVNKNESFIMSVKVDDQNGPADIAVTFFRLYRPDGTVVLAAPGQDYFPMFDNGDTAKYGDSVADDGLYSLKNSFQSTTTTGIWVFEFQGKDRSGALSNVIKHNLLVN
jgi:hypothetical protein